MKPIKFYILLLSSFFILPYTFAQKIKHDPDSILVGKRKQPAVLLVGTFHFAYYNLDAHVTDKDQQVDILSPQKQKELNELLDYIAKFKPNKIAIESGANTNRLLKKYRDYKSGKRPLSKDEIEQIGFRMMDRFQLDTVYGVDDGTLLSDLYNGKDSLAFRPVMDTIYEGWDFSSEDSLSKAYDRYFKYDDQLTLRLSLLEYFKYMNSDKVLNRGFGSYLIGDFELGNVRGADALALHWYSRNLRIYRHIQQITTSPDDRILVIYGAGHIQILKHLFECSPQYKLVKFNELR
jgi:hypothetical protein